jgi:hypothetical protein
MLIPIHEASEGQREWACAQMKAALKHNNTFPIMYVGATLVISLDPECSVMVSMDMDQLTWTEKELAAKLYLENKTESHAHYNLALKILGQPTGEDALVEEIKTLRSALERALHALEIRNRGGAYRCLDEVFAEGEYALKKTKGHDE